MQIHKQILTAIIASILMLVPLVMPVLAEYSIRDSWFDFLCDIRIGLSMTIAIATIYLVLPWFVKKIPNLEHYFIQYESKTLFLTVLGFSLVALIFVWTLDWGYSLTQC